MKMREYQEQAILSVLDSGTKNNLIVLPTGAGKTPMVMELAKRRGRRTLMIAHRDELINQAAITATRVWPEASIGIIKGTLNEFYCDVVIASIQSLARRLQRINPDIFGTIITDEAHHARGKTYEKTYRHFGVLDKEEQKAVHVGITATPNRSDGQLLGEVYDRVAYEVSLLDLIPEYLCDLKIIERNSGISIDGVKMSAGDFNVKQLGIVLNTDYGNNFVIDFYLKHAATKLRTIAFCADIAHSEGLCRMFLERSISAAVLSSLTPLEVRRNTLERFRAGEIKVITNCGILTEGFDCPELDCIILARPTKSELLMMQQIGRVTRKADDKNEGLVLNIACTGKLAIASPAKLFDIGALDETKTLTELVKQEKENKEKKEREPAPDINVDEMSKKIDSIFDTRTADRYSKLNLGWISNPWFGWSLNFGGMGIIHISADKSDSDLFTVTHYMQKPTEQAVKPKTGQQTSIYYDAKSKQQQIVMETENKTIAKDIRDIELAFEIAEDYIMQDKMLNDNRAIVSKKARWRKDEASQKQIRFLRALARQEGKEWSNYIKSKKGKLTKAEASAAIAFLTLKRQDKMKKV